MRCSWVEKNGSRNIIDWERTKNDVRNVVSLFGGNLVHTPTSGGRSGPGGVDLLGWLGPAIIVVASGPGCLRHAHIFWVHFGKPAGFTIVVANPDRRLSWTRSAMR